MNTRRTLLPLLLLAATVQHAFSQALAPTLDSLMNSYVRQRYFTGVVFLAKGDKVLYHKAFGLADREKNIPIQPSTNFSIASVGKIFTATLVMQLVNEGKIDLQKTVQDYLPEWNIPNSGRIRVHHLLTHTGATGNYMVHPAYDSLRPTARRLDDIMPIVKARIQVKDTLGNRFSYSNSGFILLGKIVEKVTGQTYEQALTGRILAPAGMKNTYLQPKDLAAPAEATPYELFTDQAFRSVKSDTHPAFPDGGLMTNAEDLWRFSRWFMRAVPESVRQSMWTPHIAQRKNSDYGYGWVITQENGRKQVSHDGGSSGWSADFRMVPEDGYVAIALINQHLNPKEVSRKMLDVAYTGKFEKPRREFVRSAIADIDHRGFPEVKNRFKNIVESGYEYKPEAGDLITFFNGLNELKRHEQALALAELASTLFPGQAWVYECIGDAYYGMNDPVKAKAAFEQALKLDADNFWARMMLAKLK